MNSNRLLSLILTLLCLLVGAALPAQIGYVTASYHGYTSAAHQTQFTNLSGQGYRLISLAVSGGLANARYSAVWQFTSGPGWVASHDMTYTQYVAQATTWSNQGYRAKLVAASGVGSDVVVAAMWVTDNADVVHYSNLTTSSFDSHVTSQRGQGRRLTSCAPYTRNSIDYHVAVFEPDSSGIAWGAVADDDGTAWNHAFGEFTLGHARPSFLATSDSGRFTHVWRDDRIGNWVTVSGRTSTQFNADKTLYSGQGLTLAFLAARGSGSGATYCGMFQERLTPHPRTHSRTGTAVIGMSGFDDYMENTLMEPNMVRNASLAVAKNGRLVYARGYTWAEPGQFATQPTTPFRLGSISKPLCGTVIHDLISRSQGGFGLSTSLTSYLGISPYASGAQNATVRRLLRHTSGMMNAPDPFVALAWASPPLVVLPVDESIIIDYACNQSFGPLDEWEYSNAGNTALGQVVEQATGQAFMTALRARLFAPVDTSALYQQQARPANFAPGEAPYHLEALFLQPSTVHSDRRLLSGQYARDFWDSAGGAVASAVVLARVISGAFCIGDDSPSLLPAARTAALTRGTFPRVGGGTKQWTEGSWAWGDLGNGRYYYQHDGAAEGFGARCVFTSDGLCIVALANRDGGIANHTSLIAEADAATLPSHDLFPNYGLPSFPRRPQINDTIVGSVPNVSDTALVYEGEGLDQVTSVMFGNSTITSQSQNTWHSGWFVRQSATRLLLRPPQGVVPSTYTVRAFGPQGMSAAVTGTLTRAVTFAIKAPNTVQNGQPFAAIVSRGSHPDLSLAILTLSSDLLPSIAPGVVSLGIGNMFSNLAVSDARQFTTTAGAVRWDFPSIAGLPQVHFQAVVFNPFLPTPWPLPATAVETVVRVP